MSSISRILTGLSVAALLGWSCRSAVEPPEGIVLSSQGERIARHATALLKGLRVAFDVRQAVQPDPLGIPALDSLVFGVPLWDPGVAGADLGLARRAAAANPLPFLDARLAASAGTAAASMPLPFTLDSALLDSLYGLDDSLIRLGVVSDSLARAPWDSLRDTLAGRWVVDNAETAAVFDSLYRYRTGDSAGLMLADVEAWAFIDPANLRLVRKQQTHRSGAAVVFTHAARVNGDVVEDTVTSVDGAARRSLQLKRSDRSAGWWHSADSSVLLAYCDSLVSLNGDISVTELGDSAYSFLATEDPQIVVLERSDAFAAGEIERSVTATVQVVRPGNDSLIAYSRTDTYRSNNVRTLKLSGLTDTLTTCTLTVSLQPSVPYRTVTSFGTVDSSRWRYVIAPAEDWTSATYTDLWRIDYYQAGARAQAVERAAHPAAPVPLDGTVTASPGTVTTTVTHAGAVRTRYQRWIWSDSGAADTLRYQWIGPNRDTIFTATALSPDSGAWSYRFDRLPLFDRRGSVRRLSGDSLEVRDTLLAPGTGYPYRIVEATVDGNGYGDVLVQGPETLEVRIDASGLSVTCPGAGCLSAEPVVWARSDDTVYTADYRDDELDMRFIATFSVNAEGYVDGALDAFAGSDTAAIPHVMYGGGISVSPLYTGTGRFYGVFDHAPTDDPFSVWATAHLELWGNNAMGEGDNSFAWP